MKVLDLFSGIGGFSLGLERAGMRTIAFCESDRYCQAVLRKHWPEVPCYPDIRQLADPPAADLVCGGFPCQPFSVAGRRAGVADDRHLWPEMRRVIASSRPAWVICENVPGLITVALDAVLADLEGLGYTARSFVIPAAAAGAHHRRDRLWVVAHLDSEGELQPRRGKREGRGRPDNGIEAAASDSDGQGPQIRLVQPGVQGEARRHDDGQDAALDAWWLAESPVVRRLHGIPGRMDRIRALGNAVYPPLVTEIGRMIMRVSPGYSLGSDTQKPGHSLGRADTSSDAL